MKITKDMTLGEIVSKYPKLANLLMEKGLPCVGCHVASEETLEQGAKAHDMDPDNLVKEMNDKLKEGDEENESKS